jgi:FkbM family methyltransferase
VRKLINRALKHVGYEIVRRSRLIDLMEQRLRRNPDFCFVQIGANDGLRFDSLYAFVTGHGCRGLVVEPLKDYFERLKLNYRDYERIIPVNLAIHATKRKCMLHRLDPARLGAVPGWAAGAGSVLPEFNQVAHQIPPEYMIQEEADCVTLMELLQTYDVRCVDLLQIDVEGYDGEIIRMIDFSAVRPAIIKYEHQHLPPAEREGVERLLRGNGYRLLREKMDTIAVLRA